MDNDLEVCEHLLNSNFLISVTTLTRSYLMKKKTIIYLIPLRLPYPVNKSTNIIFNELKQFIESQKEIGNELFSALNKIK